MEFNFRECLIGKKNVGKWKRRWEACEIVNKNKRRHNGHLKNNGGKLMTKGKRLVIMSEANRKTCV
jgi:hypothetical protein